MNEIRNDLNFEAIFEHAQRGEYYYIEDSSRVWNLEWKEPVGTWVQLNGIQRFIRYICGCFPFTYTSEEECARRSLHSFCDITTGISQVGFSIIETMADTTINDLNKESIEFSEEEEAFKGFLERSILRYSFSVNQKLFKKIIGDFRDKCSLNYRINCFIAHQFFIMQLKVQFKNSGSHFIMNFANGVSPDPDTEPLTSRYSSRRRCSEPLLRKRL